MKIQVNLGDRKRKALADAVGEALGAKPAYKGPPTYEYQVGEAIIDRNGTVILNGKKRAKQTMAKRLLEGLELQGFAPQLAEAEGKASESPETTPLPQNETPAEETTAESSDDSTIRIPLDGFDSNSLDNIRLLVNSKALILKKALDASNLTIRKSEKAIDFPWFERELSQQEVVAYTNLITAMCEMAKKQKRVMAVEKPTDNEKFVFRLFLVRLGLIGDEYADTRRILLRNLKGNGSCKSVDGSKAITRSNGNCIGTENIEKPVRYTEAGTPADAKCVSLLKQFGYFLLHIDD